MLKNKIFFKKSLAIQRIALNLHLELFNLLFNLKALFFMKKFYVVLGMMLAGAGAMQAQDSVSVKFRVTLKGTGRPLHAQGLRVTGALGALTQGDWSPSTAKVMVLDAPVSDSIYTVTLKVPRRVSPADTFEFKYINGNDWGNPSANGSVDETGVTAPCIKAGGAFGNRIFKQVAAPATSMILPCYRFNTCTPYYATNTAELNSVDFLAVAPNPMTDGARVFFTNPTNELHALDVVNNTGQVVRSYGFTTNTEFMVDRGSLAAGLYFARLRNQEGQSLSIKFVIE
jgi:Secretion system C-terminal sorting domain